ncbi:Cytochrome P450, partial [Tolypocladium paradoxum]
PPPPVVATRHHLNQPRPSVRSTPSRDDDSDSDSSPCAAARHKRTARADQQRPKQTHGGSHPAFGPSTPHTHTRATMSTVAATNSWLKAQRKSDLVELADNVGLRNYENLKKSELEAALDEFIAEHTTRFANRPDLTGYFNSRSKALGSPVKRERESLKDEADKTLKVAKRRVTKAVEELTSESDDHRAVSTSAVVRTPGRSLSQVAARIPLPATPADVANAVDRSTVAMRKRVSSIYQDSGITEVSHATREALSTVTSVLFCVSAFELCYIRPEILANRYAFTVPAVALLGSPDYPVYLPDMFLLLSASFWSPALTWAFTSLVLPSLFGYFFNLGATTAAGPRTRSKAAQPADNVVDPLTFSIVKALVAYVVYGQGVTFGGLLNETSVERLNSAVYGGYRGVLVGTAITGIVSMYDAVLRK